MGTAMGHPTTATGADHEQPEHRSLQQRVHSVVQPPRCPAAARPDRGRGWQRYRLRATSFWITNGQYGNDAFAAFPFADVNKPATSYQGARLGLSVAGGSADQWSSYNAGHTYERMVTGTGAALSFRFTDPASSDNSGSITLAIACA